MIAIRVRTWEQAAAASGPGALAAGLFLWLMMVTGAAAQQPGGYVDGGEWEDYRVSARVWLDRGQDPVVERGDRVRVFYRTSADAYVAIFHIDTNGTTRLVHPRSPEENHWVRGNRDYRLLFPRSPFWYVDDHPGIGYYFIVASPEPFDFSLLDYSYYDGGWDLHQVGRNVYSDPYVAMDDYVAALVPDWERVPYALDFASYNVGQDRYDYPRFLCYDCHSFRSFDSWNPYHYACTSFRVVIYDDPYYYPAYRYRGDRVVYVRPPIRRLPRFDFKERAEDEPPAPLLATRASNGTVTPRPGVPGDVARRTPSGVGSGGERSGESTGGREAVQRSGASGGVSGDVRRRDGSGGSVGSTGGTGVAGSDDAGSRRDDLRRRGTGAIDATGGGAVGGGSGAGDAGARDGRGGSAAGDTARWGSSSRRIVAPRRTDETNEASETRERRFVPVIPRSGDGAAAGGGTGTSGTSGASGAEAGRAGESGTAGEAGGSILRRFIPSARSGEERGRPVLERRPTSKAGVGTSGASGSSGSSGDAVRRSGGSGSSAGSVRPPVRIRSGGATGSSGSSGGAVRRSGGSGSSAGSVRPPVRIRSGGATGSSGSSGGAVRRSGGSGSSGGSVRPPVRIRSGGASGSSGSSGSSGGEVRRSGGGSSGGDVSKPPVRIRRSGSGGL